MNKIKIEWDVAFAKDYKIQGCNDNPDQDDSRSTILEVNNVDGKEEEKN